MLTGWVFMLLGVVFFFVGGGGEILVALIAGRFSLTMLEAHHSFSAAGLAIWLAGAVMMLVGWIGARRRTRR